MIAAIALALTVLFVVADVAGWELDRQMSARRETEAYLADCSHERMRRWIRIASGGDR